MLSLNDLLECVVCVHAMIQEYAIGKLSTMIKDFEIKNALIFQNAFLRFVFFQCNVFGRITYRNAVMHK